MYAQMTPLTVYRPPALPPLPILEPPANVPMSTQINCNQVLKNNKQIT